MRLVRVVQPHLMTAIYTTEVSMWDYHIGACGGITPWGHVAGFQVGV